MVSFIYWLFSRTPLPVAAAFGWLIACLWWWLVPVRKRMAVDNFQRVFPQIKPGPALRRMFAEVILGYFELFREMRVPGSVRVDYVDAEKVQADIDKGCGTLLLGGHFGSWDLVSNMICRDRKFPVAVTVKTPKNPQVAELIERIRSAFGMGLLPSRDCMPRIYEHVGNGGMVAFLLDMRFNRGVEATFFDRPARTSPALVKVAAKSSAPVYAVWFVRNGLGHHSAVFSGPLDMNGDVDHDLGQIMAHYEERIRAVPHNWFWLHDRWR